MKEEQLLHSGVVPSIRKSIHKTEDALKEVRDALAKQGKQVPEILIKMERDG